MSMVILLSSPAPKPLQLHVRFNQKVFAHGSAQAQKTWKHSMFLKTKPVVKDGVLSFNGYHALKGIPDNVVATPWTDSSLFLGATSTHSSSRHVFKLGELEDTRLLSLFRFKIWWVIPRFGNSASDIPIETQMLLLELEAREREKANSDHEESNYVVFLPVLDGELRSSLQGNSANELQVCVETGDPAVVASESLKAVFVNYGINPFDLMKESMKSLGFCLFIELVVGFLSNEGSWRSTSEHLQFEKANGKMPGMLDWFGWCTWDAFYFDVNPQGIRDGLKSLSEGGTPPRFLLIDDGWQNTRNEFQKEGEPFVEGTQFGARLVSIEENSKFRKPENEGGSDAPSGLKDFVSEIKKSFDLKYVYVWHALMGYWGGLHPNVPGTKRYNPKLKFPVQSPGNLAHQRDGAMDSMEKYGVGIIDPSKVVEFYEDLHRYLVSQNVDGVKVDVQNILETVATGLGGRVSLTRHFQQALEKSIARNFQDNSVICCMGQSTDSMYNTKRSAITRVSDDYYPQNPKTQTLHIATVAYNSILFGEVVVPDWDMFYSKHNAAEFHAVARAVGGCGIYVSDKPGQHDFTILRRLVLPDGAVLRARYPGRPSRDCLFTDPVTDGKSLLKIWNLNKFTGVIGVFNCQGGGNWPCLDGIVQETISSELSGQVSPADIEYFQEVSGKSWTGDCAVFSFCSGSLSRVPKQESFAVKLKTLECDVFTVSPIKVYNLKIQFAPIGLIDMYNSGGAVEAVEFSKDSGSFGTIIVKGRGAGRFGAYSNPKPKFCTVNSNEEAFEFNVGDNFLCATIPRGTNSWEITVCY